MRLRVRHRRSFLILLPLLAACCVAVVRGDDIGTGLTVDPTSREQSRVFYNTVYQASEGVPSGWTGNVAAGDAGTTSAALKNAINLRINYFRAMSGVSAVIRFSDAFSAADQQTALILSANRALSHDPPASWLFYTDAGANAAAQSNLALGSNDDGPAAITGYIADHGANNAAVGHRRWVLYPPETLMGTGDVDTAPDGAFLSANALWVLDVASFANPAPVPRDGMASWPPAGYVPYGLVFPRWSFSYPGADFSAATVSMSRDGQGVAVQQIAPENGYGDNTLVWVPDGLDPSNPPVPQPPATETATTVTISNVRIDGAARSFTYTVTPFDPSVPGADTVWPVLGGPAQPAVGQINAYTFNAVPGATGYRWHLSATAPFTLDLDAENGPGDVTVIPAGMTLVALDQAAHGAASYQFASQPAEAMTLNVGFVPGADGTLAFNSRLDYASGSETARAQISTDDGGSWTDLYTITGAGVSSPTEAGFNAHSIGLGAYAGKNCRVRFAYAYNGAGIYFPRAAMAGWYVDDIALAGVQTVAAMGTADVPAGQLGFTFVPSAAGDYALQVTPIFHGQYAADAGLPLMVTAVDSGPPVTVEATVPAASVSGGQVGVFTFTRAAGDLSSKVWVSYKLKGAAVNGTDYALLSGKAKFKAGKATATVRIVPLGNLGGAASKKAKLTLLPGSGYNVGAVAGAKVKIVP